MLDTMPRMSSTLNPNAPLFVPASYQATEDFSPEWFQLIQTSPAFRDYWLIERSDIMEDEPSLCNTDGYMDLVSDDDMEFADLVDSLQFGESGYDSSEDALTVDNVADSNVEKEIVRGSLDICVNDLKSQRSSWREPLTYLKSQETVSNRRARKSSIKTFRIQQPRA